MATRNARREGDRIILMEVTMKGSSPYGDLTVDGNATFGSNTYIQMYTLTPGDGSPVAGTLARSLPVLDLARKSTGN